jgi:hypothetical protein
VKVEKQAASTGGYGKYSWMGMDTVVGRTVLREGWQEEQVTQADILEEGR